MENINSNHYKKLFLILAKDTKITFLKDMRNQIHRGNLSILYLRLKQSLRIKNQLEPIYFINETRRNEKFCEKIMINAFGPE